MRKVIASSVVGCVIACGVIVSTNVRSQGGPTIYGAVAVVDTERVFNEYTEKQDAQAILDAAVTRLQDEGEALDNEIRSLEERLTKQRLFIEDENKVREMELTIREKRDDLQQLVQLGQEALADKEVALTEPILIEIRDTIRTYGETEGYDMLMEKRLVVLYHRDGMDITDDIITLLNERAAAGEASTDGDGEATTDE
jgi:Skp family chaperone for outer membrane proteins